MSGSMTVEIDGAGDDGALPGPTERLTRRERPGVDRQRQDEAAAPAVTVDVGDDNDPFSALENSRRALADRDKELAAARAQVDQERRSAAQARDQAARAQRDQAGNQRAMAAAAQSAAEAKLNSAKQAYRVARETGDTDAELEAQQAIAEATYEQRQAAAYLAQYGVGGDQGNAAPVGDTQVVGDRRVSAEAQAWIDAHPRFTSDPEYRAIALGAHTSAVESGYRENTRAYFDFIEKTLGRVYPEERPDRREQGGNDDMNQRFSGAPPSRAGGGGTGGRTVNTLFGPLSVTRRGNGSMSIQIPRDRRADWEEAARINNMSLEDYVTEQINIRGEMDAGGNAGLITTEGATFR